MTKEHETVNRAKKGFVEKSMIKGTTNDSKKDDDQIFLQTGVRSDDQNKDWLDKLRKIRLLRRQRKNNDDKVFKDTPRRLNNRND